MGGKSLLSKGLPSLLLSIGNLFDMKCNGQRFWILRYISKLKVTQFQGESPDPSAD